MYTPSLLHTLGMLKAILAPYPWVLFLDNSLRWLIQLAESRESVFMASLTINFVTIYDIEKFNEALVTKIFEYVWSCYKYFAFYSYAQYYSIQATINIMQIEMVFEGLVWCYLLWLTFQKSVQLGSTVLTVIDFFQNIPAIYFISSSGLANFLQSFAKHIFSLSLESSLYYWKFSESLRIVLFNYGCHSLRTGSIFQTQIHIHFGF